MGGWVRSRAQVRTGWEADLTSAPLSTRKSTTFWCPLELDQCRGVSPNIGAALMFTLSFRTAAPCRARC